MHVALPVQVPGMDGDYDSAHVPGLRVPAHVVTDLECSCHTSRLGTPPTIPSMFTTARIAAPAVPVKAHSVLPRSRHGFGGAQWVPVASLFATRLRLIGVSM